MEKSVRRYYSAYILVLILLLTGCAGTITVASNPAGTITVTNNPNGATIHRTAGNGPHRLQWSKKPPWPFGLDSIGVMGTTPCSFPRVWQVEAVKVEWPDGIVSKTQFSRRDFIGGKSFSFHFERPHPHLFKTSEVQITHSSNGNIDSADKYTHNSQSLQSQMPALYSQSWAVIVGISRYAHTDQNGLNNLIFADDDAKAFVRSLRNLGWNESHIRLITNEKATKRNIEIALESWLSKACPNDLVVLFWAGHGYPDPGNPEKVYFATYDTDISIPATGYRMDKVRTALEEIKAKNVILLADTCHAGKLITRSYGSRGISIVPSINKMARERKVPKGWIFMVGADTDRQAIEHTSWTNGAFTHSLIKGLNGEADGFQSAGAKDGIVTMGELKDYMKTAMPDETQKVLGVAKHPVITTSTGDPDIWNLTLQVTQ